MFKAHPDWRESREGHQTNDACCESRMPLNCTDGGAAICEFPYRFDNATSGCVSAADLLGQAFTAYNLAYAWATSLLLFGFFRSLLFSLREHKWHFVGRPSVLIPQLCAIAQTLAMVEMSNLHLLRSSSRISASLGCDLSIPCVFSALLVYFDDARPRSQGVVWCSRSEESG